MPGRAGTTPAHQGDALAGMVCSNSCSSDDGDSNAVGLLHREMRALGSLVMREADATKLPAGSALAVDRDLFAQRVTRALADHPNVALVRERIDTLLGDWKCTRLNPVSNAHSVCPFLLHTQKHTCKHHLTTP